MEGGCKAVDAHAMGLDDFALQPVTGMNRQRGMHGHSHQ
jgi:hypothetical protein